MNVAKKAYDVIKGIIDETTGGATREIGSLENKMLAYQDFAKSQVDKEAPVIMSQAEKEWTAFRDFAAKNADKVIPKPVETLLGKLGLGHLTRAGVTAGAATVAGIAGTVKGGPIEGAKDAAETALLTYLVQSPSAVKGLEKILKVPALGADISKLPKGVDTALGLIRRVLSFGAGKSLNDASQTEQQ